MHNLKLHKVLIQSLSFSADEEYLASLGGQDDNQLVVWEVRINFIFKNCNRQDAETSD